MTGSRTSPTAAIALLVIAAVVVLGAGLFGARETTAPTETFEFSALDHAVGQGVVTLKSERSASGFFGLISLDKEHYVRVTFTVPESCQIGAAENWPVDSPGCTGPSDLSGLIAGSGVAVTGNPIVSVDAAVSADCYESAVLGTDWISVVRCQAGSK